MMNSKIEDIARSDLVREDPEASHLGKDTTDAWYYEADLAT
jgi:hypothetical protein